MSRDKIPKQFEAWDFLWDQWHQWIKENRAEWYEKAITNERIRNGKSMGVASGPVSGITLEGSNIESFPDISSLDSNLINPSNWDIV